MVLGILIGLVLGCVLVAIGVSLGIKKANSKKYTPKEIEALCGCEHHFSYHDPQTGACVVFIPAGEEVPSPSDWHSSIVTTNNGQYGRYLHKPLACQCKRYSGPEPLNPYYAIESATT